MIDKDGPASSRPARLDVPPTVAYHNARGKINIPLVRRFEEQPRLWLTAWAPVGVVVRADAHVVERKRGADHVVDSVDRGARLCPARNVGLVSDHDQQEPSGAERLASCLRTGQYLHLVGAPGRVRPPGSHERAIE